MITTYRLCGVQHVYGDRCVVDIADLRIFAGEILGIVGPSGAGKSTLLRLLNFLETPTTGHVEYRGSAYDGDVPLSVRREVTTVFQRPMLLRRSVSANIRIAQRIRGNASGGPLIDQWLDRLGLADLTDAPIRTLSAGEAQRVALARALVVEPSVLLLDEPTGNLDPYNVALIERMVRSDIDRRDTTTVVVTHDPFQAKRLANRTALMISGRVVEIGETEQFFTEPQQPETRAFLRGDLVY
jgi:tungstate transport system ATP-binding protein